MPVDVPCIPQGRGIFTVPKRPPETLASLKLGSRSMELTRPAVPAADPPERTSDRLTRMAAALEGRTEGPTIAELAEDLGRLAYGMLLLICALGCALPGPPGTGAVLGAPLIVLSFGMLRGHHHPILPAFIGRRRLPPEGVRRTLLRAAPMLARLEVYLRPRTLLGEECAAEERAVVQERLTGAAVLVLGLLLSLPTPFTNLPLGVSIAILALGLLERDAWATALGMVAGSFAAALTIGLTGGWLLAGAAVVHLLG